METQTNQSPQEPQRLRLPPDQFHPGDVIRYFGELFVVAEPESRGKHVAVAVEGVDGDPCIQYFPAGESFSVLRPPAPPRGMSMAAARRGERAWLARNLAFSAAKA